MEKSGVICLNGSIYTAVVQLCAKSPESFLFMDWFCLLKCRKRACAPIFSHSCDSQSVAHVSDCLHPATYTLLDIYEAIPNEAHVRPHAFSAAEFFGTLEGLAHSTRLRVVSEFFLGSHQLRQLTEKLGPNVGPLSSILLVMILYFVIPGCRKVQKAVLCKELLQFVQHVVSQHAWGCQYIEGRALNLLIELVDIHHAAFGQALVEVSPEGFVSMLAAALGSAEHVDASVRSGCWNAGVLLSRIADVSTSWAEATRGLLNELYRCNVWPIVCRLLSQTDMPDAWLNGGTTTLAQLGKEDRGFQSMQEMHNAMTHVMVSRLAEVGVQTDFSAMHLRTAPPKRNDTWLEVLVGLFLCLFSKSIVSNRDLDLCLMQNLRRIRGLAYGIDDQYRRALTIQLLVMSSKATRGALRRGSRMVSAEVIKATKSRTQATDLSKCGYDACEKIESDSLHFQVCSVCRLERYCSRKCQQLAWRSHKKLCVPRSG